MSKTIEQARLELSEKFPVMDFSTFEFKTRDTYSQYICPIHGVRTNTYRLIMRSKNGCSACAGMGKNADITTTVFIDRLIKKYGEVGLKNTDLSKVSYINATTPIPIPCSLHPNLEPISPNRVLNKQGKTPCRICNIEFRVFYQYDTMESFLKKIPIEFEGLDSFEKANYISSKHKIIITCLVNKDHGDYSKRPNDYLNGQRCPKCGQGQSSKLEEQFLEFCKTLNVKTVVSQPIFRNRYRPDVLLPNENIAIDFHGLYWHREDARGKNHMVERLEYFQSIGVKLIQVLEDEWVTKPLLIQGKLRYLIESKSGVTARECEVKEIKVSEANQFLDKTHIQNGLVGSSYAYGLFYKGDLVSAITLGTPRTQSDRESGFIEIHRYASSMPVTGGLSKLFNLFVSKVKPAKVLTYSDRRWGEGTVYESAGFKRIGNTDPGYFWSKAQRRFSRWAFQKHKLKDLPEFKDVYKDELTEEQICTSKGYFKVYDCGHARWEKHFL